MKNRSVLFVAALCALLPAVSSSRVIHKNGDVIGCVQAIRVDAKGTYACVEGTPRSAYVFTDDLATQSMLLSSLIVDARVNVSYKGTTAPYEITQAYFSVPSTTCHDMPSDCLPRRKNDEGETPISGCVTGLDTNTGVQTQAFLVSGSSTYIVTTDQESFVRVLETALIKHLRADCTYVNKGGTKFLTSVTIERQNRCVPNRSSIKVSQRAWRIAHKGK